MKELGNLNQTWLQISTANSIVSTSIAMHLKLTPLATQCAIFSVVDVSVIFGDTIHNVYNTVVCSDCKEGIPNCGSKYMGLHWQSDAN